MGENEKTAENCMGEKTAADTVRKSKPHSQKTAVRFSYINIPDDLLTGWL